MAITMKIKTPTGSDQHLVNRGTFRRRFAVAIALIGLVCGGFIGAAEMPTEEAELTVRDLSGYGNFGDAVSLSGNTAVVGAPTDGPIAISSGSSYIFQRQEDGNWSRKAKLIPADGAFYDRFGSAVAVEGHTVLIAAPGTDAVYVFESDDDGNWTERQKLTVGLGVSGASALAIHGDTAVIGDRLGDANGSQSGAASILQRDSAGVWSEVDQLTASDLEPRDWFGWATDVSGDTALIGTAQDDDLGLNSGAVYVFRRDASGNWTESAKLKASDGGRYDFFGYSVAIEDDTAVACSQKNLTGGSGAAYVFKRVAYGSWEEVAKLRPESSSLVDRFCSSVALSGTSMLVGARADDELGEDAGAAYLFTREEAGAWIERYKITASDGDTGDSFGGAVSIDGDKAIAGAYRHETSSEGRGAAYVYDLGQQPDRREVAIDIKPDDPDNVINPRSRGRFWAAILADESFDVLQTDPASVRLGTGGASPDMYLVRDSNYDGMADLLVRFRTPSVGIVCGDTSVELTGRTYDGVEIVGEDDLRTVGCKKPNPRKKGKKK